MFQKLSGTIPPSSRNKMQLMTPTAMQMEQKGRCEDKCMQGEVYDVDVDASFIGCLFGSASSNQVREPSR